MTPLYIFDLDGTLADIRHRRHFVERPNKEKDWKAFYAACVDDKLVEPVVRTLRILREANAHTWIWSGRSDEVRSETVWWLRENGLPFLHLNMRAAGDYTPDDVLKRSWYEALPQYDKNRLVAVFDDRDRVVKMWRSLGLTCFHVADGDF